MAARKSIRFCRPGGPAKTVLCCLAAFLGTLPFAGAAIAQEQGPFVEIQITPEQVSVGEPVTMRVSVFVPTWFAKPPTFPSFEIPNAITRLPPNSSRPVSKRIGRDTWSGVSRNYQVYPLLGARFRLDSQKMDIQYANPGADPVRTQIETGDIEFTALVPDGAGSLDPYVSGTRLELTRHVEGDMTKLGTGDAVVVTYEAELDGLPAIFLPEIVELPDVAGVSVYPEQPVVEDGSPSRRTEKLTFIFNAGGNFEIPAVEIDWWDTGAERIRTASLPVLPISVAGPPVEAVAGDNPPEERDWWVVFAVVAVLVLAMRWLRGRALAIKTSVIEKERQRHASEPYAWEQTKKALNGSDARRAHEQIVRWLDRLEPGLGSRGFAAHYGDTGLEAELAALNRSLYSDSAESANLGKIGRKLSSARKRCLAERSQASDAELPPLNP